MHAAASAGAVQRVPEGFSYRTFGAAGTRMNDGLPTPPAHDGQAVFAAGSGRVRLVRNHELDLDLPGVTRKALGPRNAYDRAAPAGCTSSLYDLSSGRLLESFLVLNGTLDNCSGAHTPWGSWLSCEETTDGVGAGYEKPHGYVFEVPSSSRGPVTPEPLKAMGRFEHETAPVDPATGIVYMTEDNGDPHWVDIDEPDPSDAEDNPGSVYSQGRAEGGCRFLGLEGSAWTVGGVTFVASEAGDSQKTLNQPDTVGVSPDGTVFLAEDGDGEDADGGDNWLRVLTPRGGIANLARVIEPLDLHYWDPSDFPAPGPTGASELAGAAFTADGRHLFINVQYPGVTCVITGPWHLGV
ncbi:alkaline phosphatase PhoX [Actinoplanes sp. NPDC051411]|uniref:alkaline phosphatase PhoX n=1 Tax=Actinoplanes sp. NPDC051411 TaxID=3155522 RepID=UPI00341C9978